MSETPIHLAELSIAKHEPYSQASVKVEVWFDQSMLDGLHTLITAIEGFKKAGTGTFPGDFQTIMLYRNIESAIRAAEKAYADSQSSGL